MDDQRAFRRAVAVIPAASSSSPALRTSDPDPLAPVVRGVEVAIANKGDVVV